MCNCGNTTPSFSFEPQQAVPTTKGITSITSIDYGNHTPHVNSELQDNRLAICKSCELYTKLLNKDRCSHGNGSFLKAKTSLSDQHCPHPEGRKW
jgi:hypothetical protein